MRSQADNNVISDVTCSVCLHLYEFPKQMPSCPHTFCLKCLERLPRSFDHGGAVRCPACRTTNAIPQGGFEQYQTNLIAQNIVEKVMLQTRLSKELMQDNGDDRDVCIHSLFMPDNRQRCRHCNKEFCYSCKFHHMERLKNEILQMSQQTPALDVNASVAEMNARMARKLKQDLGTVETQLEAISTKMQSALSSVRSKLAHVRESSEKLVEQEMSKTRSVVSTLVQLPEIEELQHRERDLVAMSIFHQDLDAIVDLYEDLSRYNKAAGDFRKALDLNDSPFLKFEEVPLLRQLASDLENVEVGVLKVNQKGSHIIDLNVDEPAPRPLLSVAEQSKPKPKPATSRRSLFNIAKGGTSSNESFQAVPQSSVAPESPSTESPKIFALDSRGLFAVLHGGNKLKLFNSAKQLKFSFLISAPSDVSRFDIDALVADPTGTLLYFTAKAVSDDDGELSWRLYVVNLRKCRGQKVMPTLLAVGGLEQSFQGGLVFSSKMQWLLTTENDYVVAYSLEGLEEGELATRVRRWHVGPQPYLHGIDDSDFDDEGVNVFPLVCSLQGNVVTYPLLVDEQSASRFALEKIPWTLNGRTMGQKARLSEPTQLYYWRRKALIEHNDHIYVFKCGDLLSAAPMLVRTFPTSPMTGGSSLCEFSGMAAGRCGDDGKLYCAAIFLESEVGDFDIERDIAMVSFSQ